MAIKLMSADSLNNGVCTVFADTKAEVPATAAAIFTAIGNKDLFPWVDGLEAGTVIYTASLEIGVLKSDGTVQWGE